MTYDESELHSRNQGGYEDLPATQMLAASCIYCGKELLDPHSIQRGCGDVCADKYGVFTPTHGVDEAALESALQTAPEKLATAVREASDPAIAMERVNHLTAYHWERGTEHAKQYIGAAIEIAGALGFTMVAQKLVARYIEGERTGPHVNGFIITPSAGGMWRLKLPYMGNYAIWRETTSGLFGAGAREEREGKYRFYDFAEANWPRILNVLVRNFAGELGVLPTGETFIVPDQPVPVAAPDTPPAGAPDAATNERPPAMEIYKGDVLVMKDGREVVVGWVGDGRIGVKDAGPAKRELERWGRLKGPYEFVGTTDVKLKKATAAELAEASKVADAKPSESKWVPKEREYPSEMFEYQRETALWLDTVGSGICALDMGLGKTLCAIAVADAPVVVICPARLRVNWTREVNRWRPDLTVASVGIVEKTVKKRGVTSKVVKKTKSTLVEEQLDADVVIVNYEALSDTNVEKLKARGIKTLIVDEAHYVKEVRASEKREPRGSKRAVAVIELARHAERRLMLTGTPMINGRPYELWPLLHAVSPKDWPSFYSYCKRYCAPEKMFVRGREFTDYNGKANTAELRDKVHGRYMIRKTKDELDLPEKQRRTVEIALDEDSAKEYVAAAQRFLEWVEENGGWEAVAKAKKAEALVQMTALRRLSANGKAEGLAEECFLHLKSTGRPLVVMGHHRDAREKLAASLREQGVKVALFPEEGQQAIDHFQLGVPADAPEDERDYLDAIVCSIQAAGVGLTLTRASEMFFLERAWRPFDLVQAEDRIYRIGQRNKVVVTYFDGSGTIDMKIRELLIDKSSTALEVIDGVDVSDDAQAVELVLGAMFGGPRMRANQGEEEWSTEDFEWAQPDL